VKLHHLLQKCSLFLIKLAALAAGLNSEPQNVEGWNRFTQSFFKWTEYITSTFIIHYWIFDIRFFRVSF